MLFSFSVPVPAAFANVLQPTYWLSGSQFSQHAPGWTDPRVAARACFADARASKRLIIIDCETTGQDAAVSADIAESLRGYAPEARITAYGPTVPWNLEDFLKAPADQIQRWLRAWSRFYSNLDYVCVPAYLLGPGSVDRDLAYADRFATAIEPNGQTPIFAVWGNFHTNWNPDGVALPSDVAHRYAGTVLKHGGNAIVFDPRPGRDDELIRLLSGLRPPVRPAARP